MKTLEKQYLIEAETKLEALKNRLQWEADQMFEISKSSRLEVYRLMEYVNQLKKELGEADDKK